MVMMARTTRWHAVVVLSAIALLACEPSVPAPSEESRQAVEGAGETPSTPLPSLTVDDLLLDRGEEAGLEREEVVRRFRITRETARAYALNWVRGRQELAGEPRVCLALPWLDRSSAVIAHQFVMTDLPECSGYEDLLAHLRDIAADAVGAERPLVHRTRSSSEHFFTLAVSSLVIHHPIRDGIKGLPFWLISFDRLQASGVPAVVAPVAVYPQGNEGGLIEVVEYERSDGERLLYTHHRGLIVDREALRPVFDASEGYERFRAMVMTRYRDAPSARLERHLTLWTWVLGRAGDQ